jgi:hypothetical protein
MDLSDKIIIKLTKTALPKNDRAKRTNFLGNRTKSVMRMTGIMLIAINNISS